MARTLALDWATVVRVLDCNTTTSEWMVNRLDVVRAREVDGVTVMRAREVDEVTVMRARASCRVPVVRARVADL